MGTFFACAGAHANACAALCVLIVRTAQLAAPQHDAAAVRCPL